MAGTIVGRTALTSLAFTFAMASASWRRWADYPDDEEDVDRLLLRASAPTADAGAAE